MTLYRPHRGSLADAMREVVSVKDRNELIKHLRNAYMSEVNEDGSNVTLEKYGTGIDDRIGWDTYIVMVDTHPYGFTDGPLT